MAPCWRNPTGALRVGDSYKDFGFGNSDFGFKDIKQLLLNPQSEFPNLKSATAIRNLANASQRIPGSIQARPD